VADLVQLSLIVALIIGVGVLLILRAKSSSNNSRLQWLGYSLIFMTAFLIAFAVLRSFEEASHIHGH
jgi:drug/metabolite transporter (DMT)-like permease